MKYLFYKYVSIILTAFLTSNLLSLEVHLPETVMPASAVSNNIMTVSEATLDTMWYFPLGIDVVSYNKEVEQSDVIVVANIIDVSLLGVTGVYDLYGYDSAAWHRIKCEILEVKKGEFVPKAIEFNVSYMRHRNSWPYIKGHSYYFGLGKQGSIWELKGQIRCSSIPPYKIEDRVSYYEYKKSHQSTDFAALDTFIDVFKNSGKYYPLYTDISIESDKYVIVPSISGIPFGIDIYFGKGVSISVYSLSAMEKINTDDEPDLKVFSNLNHNITPAGTNDSCMVYLPNHTMRMYMDMYPDFSFPEGLLTLSPSTPETKLPFISGITNSTYYALPEQSDILVSGIVSAVAPIAITGTETLYDGNPYLIMWHRVKLEVKNVIKGDFGFDTVEFVVCSDPVSERLPYVKDFTFHLGMKEEGGVYRVLGQIRASPFSPFKIEDHILYEKKKSDNPDMDFEKYDAIISQIKSDADAWYKEVIELNAILLDVSIEKDKYLILTFTEDNPNKIDADYNSLKRVAISWPSGEIIRNPFISSDDAWNETLMAADEELQLLILGDLLYPVYDEPEQTREKKHKPKSRTNRAI